MKNQIILAITAAALNSSIMVPISAFAESTYYRGSTGQNGIGISSDWYENTKTLPVVVDNTELTNSATNLYPRGVVRKDFASGNGAPPLVFQPQTGTCTSHSMVNDGGSCVDTVGGNSWKAVHAAWGADFREWGAVAGADVTTQLQAAINWACTQSAKLVIPYVRQSPYILSGQIVIGDGTTTSWSTKCNETTIEGDVFVPDIVSTTDKLLFQWSGALNSTPVFLIQGPLSGTAVRNLSLNCLANCTTGFRITNVLGGRFENLTVRRWAGNAAGDNPCMIIDSLPNNTLAAANEGTFYRKLYCGAPTEGTDADGIQIGVLDASAGTTAVITDTFDHIAVQLDRTTGSNWGFKLGLVSRSIFNNPRCVPSSGGGSNGTCVVISPPTGQTQNPQNIVMVNPYLAGGVANPGSSWTATSGIQFVNWDLSGGAHPSANTYGQFYGTTADGAQFGQKSGNSLSFSSSSTALTLSGATFTVGTGCTTSGTVQACTLSISQPAVLHDLEVRVSAAPGSGNTDIATITKNGAATTLTCTISNTSTLCSDLDITHAVSVVAGDRVGMIITGSAGAAGAQVQGGIGIDRN